jgi:hypothetical protein
MGCIIRAAMTPEQLNAVANVVVDYLRLQAEFRAVRSMLAVYQKLQVAVPVTWENDLSGTKSLPEYRDFLEGFEPELSQVLRVADETSLIALLRKIEQKNLPN